MGVLPGVLGRQGEGIWFSSTYTKLSGTQKHGFNLYFAKFRNRNIFFFFFFFPLRRERTEFSRKTPRVWQCVFLPAPPPHRPQQQLLLLQQLLVTLAWATYLKTDYNHWPARAQTELNVFLGGCRPQWPSALTCPQRSQAEALPWYHHGHHGQGEADAPGTAERDDVWNKSMNKHNKKKWVSLGSFCNKVI